MTATNFTHTGYASFEEMCKAEYSFVFDIVEHRVRNRAIAEEITQDIFERLLHNIEGYTPQENKPLKESFKSWAGTIAKNMALNYCRRKNLEQNYFPTDRHETRSGEDIAYNSGEVVVYTPEDLLQIKEGLEGTLRAIESISDQGIRETARLWFVEDKPYKEISAALAIPLGTVMSRIYRATAKMKDFFVQP